MIGRNRATKARDKLKQRLRSVRWVKDVRLAKGPYGYCVALIVDTTSPEVHKAPMHIDGVEVICKASTRARQRALVGADFGTVPVSTIKEGGPIYKTEDDVVMLSPGRYTYSDVINFEKVEGGPLGVSAAVMPAPDSGFPSWLSTYRNFVDVLQKKTVQSTYSLTPVDLYADYEFVAKEPVAWAGVTGLPTWLPEGANIKDYWGRGQRPTEDIPDISLPSLPQASGILWAAAAVLSAYALAQMSKNRRRRYA